MDQTLLNWLYYTSQIQRNLSTVLLQPRGAAVVNAMRYGIHDMHRHALVHIPPPNSTRWPALPFVVRNDDNSTSPVIHQFDVDGRLRNLLDAAALEYLQTHP